MSPTPTPTLGTGTRVARNAWLLSGATIAARLTAFAMSIVLARVLGADEYGHYGLGLAAAGIIVGLTDLGLTPYLIREVARSEAHGEGALRTIVATKVALALAGGGALTVGLALTIDDPDLLAALVVMGVAALVDGIAQLGFGYFQGRERMGFEATLTTSTAVARSVGGIVIVLVTGELVPVLVWLLLVSLVKLALTLRRLRAPLARKASGDSAAVRWRSVWALGLTTVFILIYLRADALLIGVLLDEEAVGRYTAAYTILLGLQIVPWMIATALTPTLARTFAASREAFEMAWKEGLRAVLVVAVPLALATSLLAAPLIDLVFGGEFAPAAQALAIVVFAAPLAALNVLTAGALRGAGREARLMVVSGAGAAVNVVANLWAIPRFGIDGAAAVTIATEGLILVVSAALVVGGGIAGAPVLPLAGFGAALVLLAAVAVAARDAPVVLAYPLSLAAFAAGAAVTRTIRRSDLTLLRRSLGSR